MSVAADRSLLDEADTVVRLDDVALCYRLAKHRIPSIKEYAIHWMRGALTYEKLWALDGIDLRLRRGESLGVIGRNGAGKSTLLKVVSKVLRPTRGSATTRGIVAPILDLGTGFDFELTGRENIYLNALLLGHTRKQIDHKLDEIVAFSGLEDFIHSPIRNYSSGMQARLGFSIATAWQPDLLILDEVLSVGDARFIQRCEGKFDEFRRAGTAILLVSHDLDSIQRQCDRAIWIEQGRIRAAGAADEVVGLYTGSL